LHTRRLHSRTLPYLTESFPELILGGATLIFLVFLLRIHIELITTPVTIDGFESSMLAITHLIASGHIPYTAGTQPIYVDNYPPLYNALMAPLTLWFGNTFYIHRLVAGLFIGLSCWLCYYAARKKSVPKIYATNMAILLYAAWLFYATPVASPNSLGLFLFLASVIIPWAHNFSRKSLLGSIVLGLLAFYTKQYFAIGMAYIALYLFLFDSKLRGLKYGLLFVGSMIASLIVVTIICPYFIDDTIIAMYSSVGMTLSLDRMLWQPETFARIYSGLFMVLIVYWCGQRLYRENPLASGKTITKFAHTPGFLRQPLISRCPEYFTFCFICSTVVAGIYLGRNAGNYMTYLFQFMSPFLLIAAFGCFTRRPGRLLVVFVPLLIWTLYSAYAPIRRDFRVDMIPWNRVNHLIRNHQAIYTTNFLVASMLSHDKKLYTDGMSNFFFFTNPLLGLRTNNHEREREHLWSAYASMIRKMVKTKQFDLLLLNPGQGILPFFHHDAFYRRTGTVTLSLTNRRGGGSQKVIIWRPKP